MVGAAERGSSENLTAPDLSTSLDLIREHCGNSVESCPHALTMELQDRISGYHHFFETSCKRWSCPVCGPAKTWRLCRQIESAKPNRFVTLTTCHAGDRTPRQVWDSVRRQISELAKLLRRRYGAFEYVRVLEEHKSGYPHFHLVCRSPYIPQAELSRHWAHLAGAFIVDIRKVDPRRKVARYIAKYLGKQVENAITDRRVSFSRSFLPPREPKPESQAEWHFATRHSMSLPECLKWEIPHASGEIVNPWHVVATEFADHPDGNFVAQNPSTRAAFLHELGYDPWEQESYPW
jgi:hypothetical protein